MGYWGVQTHSRRYNAVDRRIFDWSLGITNVAVGGGETDLFDSTGITSSYGKELMALAVYWFIPATADSQMIQPQLYIDGSRQLPCSIDSGAGDHFTMSGYKKYGFDTSSVGDIQLLKYAVDGDISLVRYFPLGQPMRDSKILATGLNHSGANDVEVRCYCDLTYINT